MGFLGGHTGEGGTVRKDGNQGKGRRAAGLSYSLAADQGPYSLWQVNRREANRK